MKPNFALGLTEDGVTLWHRDATGWLRVGAVALDTPDMDARMRDMSRIATAIAPQGVTTKLVIPDDQILYCDLPVYGRTAQAQATEIRVQLAGRTPYPVEELVFDWTTDGNTAKAVVVARETILEAEDFAAQHGLNPIAAVAAAQKGRSATEPFFGPTRGAREIVSDISRIERDASPLVESGHVTLPDPEHVAAKPVAPKTESPETPPAKADAPASASPGAAHTKDTAPKAEPKPKPTDEQPSAKPTGSDKQAVSAPPEEHLKSQSPVQPSKADLKAATDSKKDADAQAAADRKQALFARLNAAKPTDAAQTEKPTDAKSKFAQLLAAKKAASSTAVPTPEQSEAGPSTDTVSFRSRRGGTELDAAATQKTPQTSGLTSRLREKAFGAKSVLSSAFGVGVTKAEAQAKSGTAETQPGSKSVVPSAQVSASAKSAKPEEKPAKKAPEPAAAAAKPDTKAKPADKAQAQPPRKGPIETLQAHGPQSRNQNSEAERLTIFGARSNQDMQPSGTSRAMLVLGGVGLLLVAAAIWAAYFFTTQPSDVQVAEEPTQSVALEPEITEPVDSDFGLDDIEASLGVEHAAQQAPLDSADIPTLLEDNVAQAPAEQAPTERAMGTEEMQAGRIAGLRSVALLAPQEATSLPVTPSAPAPFGSEPLAPLRSEIEQAAAPQAAEPIIEDEPTVEAPVAEAPTDVLPALPEGEELLEITVADGTPPSVPPARPEGLAPELEAPAEEEPASAPEAVTEQAPEPTVIDPLDESQLEITVTSGPPSQTPPARPEGLAPEQALPTETAPASDDAEPSLSPDATQPDEGAAVGSEEAALDNAPALGGISLTALRPAARPEALAIDPPETEEAQTASFADATDLAVAASRRPGSRPSQFSAIVQRSLRTAQPEPTPTQPQQSEPIQTARAAVPDAPAIPTSASVSREATQARAINLRQINLLGVMGTSSSRRALVRLSNGRVVTVRVGEALDGGQVTAIGDDELRYTRRGRNVVLRIAS